jgi:hypothetical protein
MHATHSTLKLYSLLCPAALLQQLQHLSLLRLEGCAAPAGTLEALQHLTGLQELHADVRQEDWLWLQHAGTHSSGSSWPTAAAPPHDAAAPAAPAAAAAQQAGLQDPAGAAGTAGTSTAPTAGGLSPCLLALAAANLTIQEMADWASKASSAPSSSSAPDSQHSPAQGPAAPGACFPALRSLSLALPASTTFTVHSAPAMEPPLPKLSHYSLRHSMVFSEPGLAEVTGLLQHSMCLQKPQQQQQQDDDPGSSKDAEGGVDLQHEASSSAGDSDAKAGTWVKACDATVSSGRTWYDHDTQQVAAAWKRALQHLGSCNTRALQLELMPHQEHLGSHELVHSLADQLPGMTRLEYLVQLHGSFTLHLVGAWGCVGVC